MGKRGLRSKRSSGHSLAETLLVVAVLSISAAAVAPSLTQSESNKVALAAAEVAGALRFARDEARRTGTPTMVELSGSARLRAYALDVSVPASPAVGAPLRHPLSKMDYDFDLNTLVFSEGVSTATDLPPGPPGAGPAVGFNARGEPLDASTLAPLTQRYVDVSFGGKTRRVTIAPLTARVSEAWY